MTKYGVRVARCDIGDSGEIHKLYREFCMDTKAQQPTPDYWLYRFSDPTFVCFVARRGRGAVGLAWGKLHPYFAEKTFELEGFFVRRAFRGKMKIVRGLLRKSLDQLKEYQVQRVQWNRPKQMRERTV